MACVRHSPYICTNQLNLTCKQSPMLSKLLHKNLISTECMTMKRPGASVSGRVRMGRGTSDARGSHARIGPLNLPLELRGKSDFFFLQSGLVCSPTQGCGPYGQRHGSPLRGLECRLQYPKYQRFFSSCAFIRRIQILISLATH